MTKYWKLAKDNPKIAIAVVVVMDFMAQVQSHLMSRQYESLMKKANLGGLGYNTLGGR